MTGTWNFIGEDTQSISQLHVDLLFLGHAVLIRRDYGLIREAEIKRAMARTVRYCVAATADQLATAAPFRVVGPEAIHHLVVDRLAQPSLCRSFRQQGILVHRA